MSFVNITCLASPYNLVIVSVLKNCGCVHVYTLAQVSLLWCNLGEAVEEMRYFQREKSI
jgi:hypothetical protein